MGLFLLAGVIHKAAAGSLAAEVFGRPRVPWTYQIYALGLALPVPFHVISVGLILQRRWLSPVWARGAWIAIVVSGGWLGLAVAIKALFL
ncbi:MAG: hypothetical protein GY856_18245 [bacterium]|nr:hypothetical protein [bacterium]